MILYHLTWQSNLKSIRKHGLIPNYKPNGWMPNTCAKCKGRTYLCPEDMLEYWYKTLTLRMIGVAGGTGKIICFAVQISKRDINSLSNSYYAFSEFYTKKVIKPEKVKLCQKKLEQSLLANCV